MDIKTRAHFDALQSPERFLAHHNHGACERKIRYHSRSAAQHGRRELIETGRAVNPDKLDVYGCAICDGWHVGHAVDPEVVPFCADCPHHVYAHQWAAVARVGCALCRCTRTRDDIFLGEFRRLRALIPIPNSTVPKSAPRIIQTARGILVRCLTLTTSWMPSRSPKCSKSLPK